MIHMMIQGKVKVIYQVLILIKDATNYVLKSRKNL